MGKNLVLLKLFIKKKVPTHFHKNIFTMGGVDSDKIKVVPEPVDTDFFNPDTPVKPYSLENASNLKYKFLSVFKVHHRKIWLTF